jgi:hypothetical protein
MNPNPIEKNPKKLRKKIILFVLGFLLIISPAVLTMLLIPSAYESGNGDVGILFFPLTIVGVVVFIFGLST